VRQYPEWKAWVRGWLAKYTDFQRTHHEAS